MSYFEVSPRGYASSLSPDDNLTQVYYHWLTMVN